MSGLARLLLARGITVTGSDLKRSRGLAMLEQLGATIHVGHRAEQVGHPDAVVISSAIHPDNPEVRAARAEGVPVLMRAQVLAALMKGRRGIAVTGTHGKTTTTSMVSVILARVGLTPTYVIGGDLNESGSGAESGSGDLFVAEADESDGSFLLLDPYVGVVTNVDEDHLDFYRDAAEIESAFADFIARCGTAVVNGDDPGLRRAVSNLDARLLRYGTADDADVRLVVHDLGPSGARGEVRMGDRAVPIDLAVPGRYNLMNATAAVAAVSIVGVSPEDAAEALRTFTGVRRRFEFKGTARGARFVDDYAHNPGKLAAVLESVGSVGGLLDGADGSSSKNGRIVAVFQPHRYTRTRSMWRALGESLRGADLVVVTDVYGAGEQPIPGVTGKLVVEALAEAAPGRRVVYLPRRADVAPFLAGEVRPGDLVLTLGAGDITMVGEETLERLRDSRS
jgi:UDP-N-acetylmuramate--alanine ligase